MILPQRTRLFHQGRREDQEKVKAVVLTPKAEGLGKEETESEQLGTKQEKEDCLTRVSVQNRRLIKHQQSKQHIQHGRAKRWAPPTASSPLFVTNRQFYRLARMCVYLWERELWEDGRK